MKGRLIARYHPTYSKESLVRDNGVRRWMTDATHNSKSPIHLASCDKFPPTLSLFKQRLRHYFLFSLLMLLFKHFSSV
jgi:hypothetical protein